MMLFWYFKDSDLSLIGYSDTDCVANADDRKSTIKGCFYLSNYLISRPKKKQISISLLLTDVEYVVLVFDSIALV